MQTHILFMRIILYMRHKGELNKIKRGIKGEEIKLNFRSKKERHRLFFVFVGKTKYASKNYSIGFVIDMNM